MQKPATNHPAFNACIDWHSSVHATWALLRYQRITADNQYEPLLMQILSAEKIQKELENFRNSPRVEMSYGRAWFLRLVIDYEKLFDSMTKKDFQVSELLKAMGDYMAESLLDYYESHGANPYLRNYSNPSWALLNLYHYAKHRNNLDWLNAIEDIVNKYFVTYKKPCSSEIKLNNDGFIAICENWAYLVAETGVLDQRQSLENYESWLKAFYEIEKATPLIETNNTYLKALNFSKSWAYKGIYNKTKNTKYLDLYREHMITRFRNQGWWSGNDYSVTHWVAQFGVYAYSLDYN